MHFSRSLARRWGLWGRGSRFPDDPDEFANSFNVGLGARWH